MWIWAVWVVGAALGAVVVSGQGGLENSPELAWLLANESPPPPVSLRRITPKSVFLAPTFTSCSEGYRQDQLGRCVKIVKINPQAQWDFLLQKLNSMYAPPAKDKPPAGPLRLPIPLEEADTSSSLSLPPTTTEEAAATTTMPSTPVPSTASTTTLVPTFATDLGERATEVPPLLIIVANTTDSTAATTTDKEWLTGPSTVTTQSEPTVDTSTELPVTTSTTDCEDCLPTSTTPPATGWFSGSGDTGDTQRYTFTASTPDPRSTTKPPSDFQASTYLPAEYRPIIRSTSRPKIEAQATAVLRPQLHLRLTTTPSPPGLWSPSESHLYTSNDPPYTISDSSYGYTTHRSTVRFPSERPPIAPSPPTYIRFPPVQPLPPEQTPIWWPPSWEHNLWPHQRPSAKPWGHREPRPSWIHQ